MCYNDWKLQQLTKACMSFIMPDQSWLEGLLFLFVSPAPMTDEPQITAIYFTMPQNLQGTLGASFIYNCRVQLCERIDSFAATS